MLTAEQTALVEKYKADWASDPTTCKQFIESDLSEENAKVVIEALSVPPAATEATTIAADPSVYNPKQPNANLDLSKFDYNNLTGDSFETYTKLVNNLPVQHLRDFTQYMASGIFKTQLNDNADKVRILIGIKINRVDPVNHTRITVGQARNLNMQIHDGNNPATNSRYFFLKKDDNKIR